MLDTILEVIIGYLYGTSAPYLLIFEYAICMALIIFLLYQFHLSGLVVYSIVGAIICNLQVLKHVDLPYISSCIPLGTVYFTTIFLSQDLITLHFGKDAAQKTVTLSCIGQVMVLIFMMLTTIYAPHSPADDAISLLFLPSLRLLISSLCAFFIAGWIDITIFSKLNKKKLWIRQFVSTLCAGWVDTLVFCYLTWIVLNPNPCQWTDVMMYTIGSQIIRMIISALCIPMIYVPYISRCQRYSKK